MFSARRNFEFVEAGDGDGGDDVDLDRWMVDG